jgi:hypothetical protein
MSTRFVNDQLPVATPSQKLHVISREPACVQSGESPVPGAGYAHPHSFVHPNDLDDDLIVAVHTVTSFTRPYLS